MPTKSLAWLKEHPLTSLCKSILRTARENGDSILYEWTLDRRGLAAFVEHVEASIGEPPTYFHVMAPIKPELGLTMFNIKWVSTLPDYEGEVSNG